MRIGCYEVGIDETQLKVQVIDLIVLVKYALEFGHLFTVDSVSSGKLEDYVKHFEHYDVQMISCNFLGDILVDIYLVQINSVTFNSSIFVFVLG